MKAMFCGEKIRISTPRKLFLSEGADFLREIVQREIHNLYPCEIKPCFASKRERDACKL